MSNEVTVNDVLKTLSDKQRNIVRLFVEKALYPDERTINIESVREVLDGMNENQKTLVYAIIGEVLTNIEIGGRDFAKAEFDKMQSVLPL